MRGHNEELPPVTFRIDIPVMAVRVSGSNPSRTGARRHFPPTCLPSIGIAIPAVISPNPDVIPAWTKGAMLPNANRRPKPDNDLAMSRYQPKGKAKQHGKNQFSHFLLQRLYEQVYGRRWWNPRRSDDVFGNLVRVVRATAVKRHPRRSSVLGAPGLGLRRRRRYDA